MRGRRYRIAGTTTKIEDNAMAFVRRPEKCRQVVSSRLAGLRRILASVNGSSSV